MIPFLYSLKVLPRNIRIKRRRNAKTIPTLEQFMWSDRTTPLMSGRVAVRHVGTGIRSNSKAPEFQVPGHSPLLHEKQLN